MQFLFNQKSSNRVAQNFLLQCENYDKVGQTQLNFKPKETVMYMKKMIRAFIYDLKYYGSNKCLFKSGIEL